MSNRIAEMSQPGDVKIAVIILKSTEQSKVRRKSALKSKKSLVKVHKNLKSNM